MHIIKPDWIVYTIKRLRFVILFFLVAGAVHAELAVKAFVDRTVVGLNQQFTLHVELSGEDMGDASAPSLPSMDAFAVYLGSGTSQNIQFINGQMSASKIISYHYQATKTGKYQIGSIQVTAKGETYSTAPIDLEIVQSAPSGTPGTAQRRPSAAETEDIPADQLFVRVLADKKEVYQNQPVTLTYKIYTLVNVSSFGFSKMPGAAGFWVEEFPLSQQPQTETEIIEGKRYTTATIKKMALFPMSPGLKTIDPIVLECDVRVRRRSRDVFDDFFNDPFFGQTMRKTIASRPVEIRVLPLPGEGKPADFSGVVGKFQISSVVDKKSVKTNEAVTYQLNIRGEGNIKALPEPAVPFSPDFEVYPPKVTENISRSGSVSGSKTYEYVLIPRVSGQQKIRPYRLSVFDPAARKYTTLETGEIVIDVAKGEDVPVISSGLSKQEVALIGQDIRFLKTDKVSFTRIGQRPYERILFWLLLFFPLAALGGAALYREHLEKVTGDIAYARNRQATRIARKRLASARSRLDVKTQKEFYAEVGKALISYVGNKLNISEAGMISDPVKDMLKSRGVEEKVIESYFECITVCDMKRFSPQTAAEEEMQQFLKKAESAIAGLDRALSR